MKKFTNHLMAEEYDQAAQYGTESTKQMVEMLEALASVGSYMDEEIIIYTDSDFDCTVTDDTAVCRYVEYGEPVEATLVKVDGTWLVDIPMDDMYNDDESWYEDENEDEDKDWEFDGTETQLK